MKSEHSGAPKLGTLRLSCKANKCSDFVAGDLGMPLTTETSLREMTRLRLLQVLGMKMHAQYVVIILV